MTWLDSFHFIRPLWLLALLPWLALVVRAGRNGGDDTRWTRVIDPALLRALTPSGSDVRPAPLDRLTVWAALLGGLIGVIALAGPSWRYQPTPVFQTSQSRVIVMDLSESMNAQDLAPDRLTRARFAALDLIDALPDGRIGVVAFAGTAHSVVPLTADHRTARHLVSTLSPDLMPVPGSNVAAGLRQAESLLTQGDAWNGDIVLLTDSEPDAAARTIAQQLSGQGFRLAVVGFGTADGAPIPSARGGWIHGRDGRMSLAKLDEDGLRRLAANGGGRYLRMPAQAITPQQLGLSEVSRQTADGGEDHRETQQWEDAGPWLLFPLVPLMLLAFRRGAPWLTIVVLLAAPLPRAEAFDIHTLWKNADQRGHDLLQSGEPAQAEETFSDPRWRGIAAYRAGDYEAAIAAFTDPKTADDAYNLGNALARAGDLDGASDAYAKALELDPRHDDAAFNQSLIDQLKRQQDQQGDQGGEQEDGDDRGEQDDQNPKNNSEDGSQASDSSQSANDAQSRSRGEPNRQDSGEPSDAEDASEESQREEAGEQAERTPEQASEDAEPSQDQTARSAAGDPGGDETDPAKQAAVQQWLRRVPDDPGGLLRNKFLLEQQRRQAQRQGDGDG